MLCRDGKGTRLPVLRSGTFGSGSTPRRDGGGFPEVNAFCEATPGAIRHRLPISSGVSAVKVGVGGGSGAFGWMPSEFSGVEGIRSTEVHHRCADSSEKGRMARLGTH